MAKQTTIAAVCLAAAATFAVVTWGQPQSAGTGGDPCPSDIDNDGDVGITDFLQLLADWGPCPAGPPRVVSITSVDVAGSSVVFRLWSDNRIEGATFYDGNCRGDCPVGPPVNEWFDVDLPSLPPGELPVGLSYYAMHLWITYSNGTTFRRISNLAPCGCTGGNQMWSVGTMLPWEEFLPGP